MRHLLLILGALLLAMPAAGADWLKFGRAGAVVTGLQPGEWASNRPAANTADTLTLAVGSCFHVDILHHLDVNGDATASSTTIKMRSCPTASADADACWVIENVTLNGAPATDTEGLGRIPALYIYGDLQADGTINDPQLTVICRGPRQ